MPALDTDLKYYSTLAMTLHVWRDVARDIYSCWIRDFGSSRAVASAAGKVPPRPIKGRWGVKTKCEDYLLGNNEMECVHCFCTVVETANYYKHAILEATQAEAADAELTEPSSATANAASGRGGRGSRGTRGGRGSGRRARSRGGGSGRGGAEGDARHSHRGGVFDEMDEDTKDTFSKTMGKWSSRAHAGMKNPCFWLAMRISNRISHVLDHLLYVIEKTTAPGELKNLAVLVHKTAWTIEDDLWNLSQCEAWTDIIDRVEPCQKNALMNGITKVVLGVYADYKRRVTDVFRENWSYRLLWVVHCPAEQPSEIRQRLAEELVGAARSSLHITAYKLVTLFENEIIECARSEGRISNCVFALIMGVATNWPADTQEIEGIMSMVKAINRRCPNAKLPYVDAVVGNRKDAGMGSRGTAILRTKAREV